MDWPWPEANKITWQARFLNFLAVLPFLPLTLLFLASLAVKFGWVLVAGRMLDLENYRWDLAQGYLQIAAALLVIGVLVASWLHDFPLWTYPYWVLATVMTISLPFSDWYFLVMLGSPRGYDPLGWYGLVPAALALLLILVLRRSLDPFRRLLGDLRAHRTRISFLIYCLSPALLMLAFRQAYNGTFLQLLLEWVLAGAALACLVTEKPARRLRAMAAAQAITWLWAGLFLNNYWRDHANSYIPDMPGHLRAAMLVMVLAITLTVLAWRIGRNEYGGAKP